MSCSAYDTFSDCKIRINLVQSIINLFIYQNKLSNDEILSRIYANNFSSKEKLSIFSHTVQESLTIFQYIAIDNPNLFYSLISNEFFTSIDLEDKQNLLLEPNNILSVIVNSSTSRGKAMMNTEQKINYLVNALVKHDDMIDILVNILHKNDINIIYSNATYLAILYPEIFKEIILSSYLSDKEKQDLILNQDHDIINHLMNYTYDNVSIEQKNSLLKHLINFAANDHKFLYKMLFNSGKNLSYIGNNSEIFAYLNDTIKAQLFVDYFAIQCNQEFYKYQNAEFFIENTIHMLNWDHLSSEKQDILVDTIKKLFISIHALQTQWSILYESEGLLSKIPLKFVQNILSDINNQNDLVAVRYIDKSNGFIINDIMNKADDEIKSTIMEFILNDFSSSSQDTISKIQTNIDKYQYSNFKDSNGFSLAYLLKASGKDMFNESIIEGIDTPLGFRIVNQDRYNEFIVDSSNEVIISITGYEMTNHATSILHHKGINVLSFDQNITPDISFEKIIEDIAKYKEDHANHKIKMILINTHGGIINLIDSSGNNIGIIKNEMSMSLSKSTSMQISNFLKAFTDIHAEPLDFVMSSCASQLASTAAIQYLPIGSNFLAMGEYNNNNIVSTISLNYDQISQYLSHRTDIDLSSVSAESILKIYLTNLVSYPTSPTFIKITEEAKQALNEKNSTIKEAIIDLPLNIEKIRKTFDSIESQDMLFERVINSICFQKAESNRDNFYLKHCISGMEKAFNNIKSNGFDFISSEYLNSLRPKQDIDHIYMYGQYHENFTEFGNLLALKAELLLHSDEYGLSE